MDQQIIISCLEEDKRYKNKIQKWASSGKLGNRVYVISQDDSYFYNDGGDLDRERLSWALKDSALVIILLGNNNLDHPWLDWEGEFCHQWGIRRVLLRIPYTNGELPESFRYLSEIAYNPNAIEKLLIERKNQSHYH